MRSVVIALCALGVATPALASPHRHHARVFVPHRTVLVEPAPVALYPVEPAQTTFGTLSAPINYVPDPTAPVAFSGRNWNGIRSPYQYPNPDGFGGYYGAPDAFGGL